MTLIFATLLLATAVSSVVSIDCSLLQCVTNWEPVCGNDGVTYGNECELEIANCYDNNITLAYNGSCHSDHYNSFKKSGLSCDNYMEGGKCGYESDPICGSDGKTYPNFCVFCEARFDNEELTFASIGFCADYVQPTESTVVENCKGYPKDTQCTEETSLICGNDNVTYRNKCKFCNAYYHLKNKDFELVSKHPGACNIHDYCPKSFDISNCPLVFMPICASNGNTYLNMCAFCAEAAATSKKRKTFTLQILSNGICDDDDEGKFINGAISLECSQPEKLGVCSEHISGNRPVCGKDGVSYPNKCEFCLRNSQNDEQIAHLGQCKIKEITSTPSYVAPKCDEYASSNACPDDYNPVCGSNGITYPNNCLFCFEKLSRENEGSEIYFKRTGECTADDFCTSLSKLGACTYEYNPVCASDGKTYANLCTMCAYVYREKNDGDPTFELKVKHYGECIGVIHYNDANDYDHETCKIWENRPYCVEDNAPICGSDDVSYSTECSFCQKMYEQRKLGKILLVKFYGECPSGNRCPPKSVVSNSCPTGTEEVCASNGITYQNECLMCRDMYVRQANGENIFMRVNHKGRC